MKHYGFQYNPYIYLPKGTNMLNFLLYLASALIFGFFVYSAWVSYSEKEKRASGRLILLALILPWPFILAALYNISPFISGLLLLMFCFSALMFFLPLRRDKKREFIVPAIQIDERDTMFSRDLLLPDTPEYKAYYENHPENKPGDDALRDNPGLLSERSAYYHPWIFSSAKANFELIEKNRQFVDGEIREKKVPVEPGDFSQQLKNLVRKYGAVSAGITRLQDYHLYSHRGRKHNYGKPVQKHHEFALAFTVEMDHEFVRNAPYALSVLESSRQYVRSGMLALWIAQFIRDMGYPARAHIDGEYEVVCPLVARDAGLGKIGRMGLLMTPELGPRVRIAVVTASVPLIPDGRKEEFSMIDFCTVCKKCAENCPSNAIPFGDRKEIDGALRWQIDQQVCFRYWTKVGTDCARCMSVCPFSHPNNPLHNLVRYGIRNSSPFRKFALWMDDFIYGRKPRPLSINSSEF